ncbi:helix-turn-helix domain-containing protein [Chryseobacterium indoltheticum]
MDHSNISKIEKGEVDLRISTIQELSKGLNTSPRII